MSLTTGQKIIKVKGTTSLHWFSIFIWFSHGRSVLYADIVLSDAWLGAVVCESNMMITMTNNLLCILHDVGYIQMLHITRCRLHTNTVKKKKNTEIPKVTYYYVLILNLNLKCIINFLKVISIS